jgi:hypothetical protein
VITGDRSLGSILISSTEQPTIIIQHAVSPLRPVQGIL